MLAPHLQFFADAIDRELGIVYDESNEFQLRNRLEAVAKSVGIASIEELHQSCLKSFDPQVRDKLFLSATNHETSFFRDPRVFAAVEEELLPSQAKALAGATPLRVWSAACSHGQETYSLAMLLHELSKRLSGFAYEITATDVSVDALAKAKSGIYNKFEVGRGLAPEKAEKHFESLENGDYRASPHLRAHIQFSQLNLKNSFAHLGTFHLIFCRNVLIYQKIAGKIEVTQRLAGRLHPGGYLVLGAGESLVGISESFEQVMMNGAIVYRLKSEAK